MQDFSLYATVHYCADALHALEQLCRDVIRQAPAWAELLRWMFELDLEQSPSCGGELKIIAANLEAPVIEKILTHLISQARTPPRSATLCQALQAA